jgi:hypothetical protein
VLIEDPVEVALNVTKQIQNMSDYARTCYVALDDYVQYERTFYSQFQGWADFGTSFF